MHPAVLGSGAVPIHRSLDPRLHPIIDQRISRTGIEGKQRAVFLRHFFRGLHPSDVCHPANVQKCQWLARADALGQGEMVERRKRRSLPACLNIRGSEIRDGRNAQLFCQSNSGRGT